MKKTSIILILAVIMTSISLYEILTNISQRIWDWLILVLAILIIIDSIKKIKKA